MALHAAVVSGIGSPISRGSHMQQQFFQVFRLAFNLIKAVIYIVFTITLGSDLSHVHSLIETGIVLGADWPP
jgi:phosphate/sulfate permease